VFIVAKERDGHDGSKRCPVGGEGKHSDHTLNYKGHTYSDHGRRDGCYDRVDSNSNSSPNSYGGNTSSYPTGVSKGGYSGGGHNFVTSGDSGGINTLGGSYAYGYDYGSGKHDYNISFKSIMDRTSSPAHGYLIPEKSINLRYNNLTDKEIAVLVGNLQYQQLDLDVFDVSNNKIGFGGVENLFYGLRFDNTLASRYIVTMNFSNNLIGDDGAKYMSDSLAMGRFPHLKSLDVSGNHITATGYGVFIKSLKTLPHDIIVTLEKYSTNLGQKVIKPALKHFVKYATEQGVNTVDVATNKGGIGYLMDTLKIIGNIAVGVTKCSNTLIEILLLDTTAPSMVKGLGLEMYGSTVAKKVDFRVCVALEVYDGIVSTEGVDLAVKAVDLIGDN